MGVTKQTHRSQVSTGLDLRLNLHILLQSLEDILNYELSDPLQGHVISEDEYETALLYVYQFPSLVRRLQLEEKAKWLRELQEVRDDLS